jgi:hypothetical protein
MPGERLSMRKIREILRLRWEHHLPQRAIGQSLRLSQGSVSDYLGRARRAGLSWPLPDGLDDARLEALLFPPPPDVPSDQRPMPDWAAVHRDLRRPNVTLALLWEAYQAATTDGFGYSWFCDLYRAWAGRLKPMLRQVHIAGERLFVDFAGHTMEVIDAPAKSVVPRSSLRCWGRRASFTPKRPGARRWRIGFEPVPQAADTTCRQARREGETCEPPSALTSTH